MLEWLFRSRTVPEVKKSDPLSLNLLSLLSPYSTVQRVSCFPAQHGCHSDKTSTSSQAARALAVRYPDRLSEMSAANRKLIQALVETISKQVEHFNKAEVECLIRGFNGSLGELAVPEHSANGLDRGGFRSILHNWFGMTDYMIMDGVFRTFDKDNDSLISVKEWVEGMSIFLRGSLDEKIKYCFHVYDLNGDNYISREEMFQMLKNSLSRQPTEEDPDERIKDLVEITLKKMDHDHDGRLSFDDFEKAVREENLLLEAFGSCLPDTMSIETFERHVFEEQPEH